MSENKKNVTTSIIIPVYNAEKTISYCLDSILKQTEKDYEIILINDGSKDNSQSILEDYRKRFPSIIRIFHQKNVGVSITRNRGIHDANGKYLLFIDNDDYIDEDYINRFVSEIEGTNADMVIGGYKRVDIQNNKILFRRNARKSPWTKYMFLAPWARIYKKDSLLRNDLAFLDINIGEDVYLNILSNLKLKTEILDYSGYNWVYNKESVSNTKHKGLRKDIQFIDLLERINSDIKEDLEKSTETELVEYFFIKTSIYYILHSGRHSDIEDVKIINNKIIKWLEKNYPNYKKNKQVGIFKPVGEHFFTSTIVTIIILLRKIKLENIFLKIYSKI